MFLVGGIPTPLKNMSSSVGVMKFPIYGKIKLMFQTTNQVFIRKSSKYRKASQVPAFLLAEVILQGGASQLCCSPVFQKHVVPFPNINPYSSPYGTGKPVIFVSNSTPIVGL